MRRHLAVAALAASLLLAACAATAPPPPQVTPTGEDRFLASPLVGWRGTTPAGADAKLEAAWRFFLAGNDAEASRRLAELQAKNPAYTPVSVARAGQLLRDGRNDEAAAIITKALAEQGDYTAARIYEAEIAYRGGDVRTALARYRALANDSAAPVYTGERIADFEARLYQSLISVPASASDAEAIASLREALALRPSETEPRIMLTQRLIANRSFEDARSVLEPLVNSSAVDRPEVQAALAEIDVSRGRYQEAIVRLDRLARRTRDTGHARRLGEVKELWSSANMPPHFTRALQAESITRADLAVLIYWKVNAVRFAQDLNTPPIAVDLSEVAGREEVIRAMAVGLYEVDPVTRRVSALRTVNTSSFTRLAARLLAVRGAACARVANEPGTSELLRAQRILAACAVSDAILSADGDAQVSGRAAAAVMEQVDRALSR